MAQALLRLLQELAELVQLVQAQLEELLRLRTRTCHRVVPVVLVRPLL